METDKPNHENENVAHELTALEQRLAAWRPASGALDRDRMLYDAGRAAAQAENPIPFWPLATAALLVISIGLGGLLVHQRSLRAQDRNLLAQEQSRRHILETTLAARDRTSGPSSPLPSSTVESPPIERLPSSSYFVLTSRLTRSAQGLSSPEFDFEPEPRRPGTHPSERSLHPGPLQTRDIQRVLEL
jgi:hypothetical protein